MESGPNSYDFENQNSKLLFFHDNFWLVAKNIEEFQLFFTFI
jgi:hypothetical protein